MSGFVDEDNRGEIVWVRFPIDEDYARRWRGGRIGHQADYSSAIAQEFNRKPSESFRGRAAMVSLCEVPFQMVPSCRL